MEKEYIAGEPQRYEIGGRVFIVEPRYRKDGESMADILLNCCVVVVTHDLEVAKAADVVFRMDSGRLKEETV